MSSILPLLHLLRLPDEAASALMKNAGVGGEEGGVVQAAAAAAAVAAAAKPAREDGAPPSDVSPSIQQQQQQQQQHHQPPLATERHSLTAEQLWTSHRPLQWFNPHALKSTLQASHPHTALFFQCKTVTLNCPLPHCKCVTLRSSSASNPLEQRLQLPGYSQSRAASRARGRCVWCT